MLYIGIVFSIIFKKRKLMMCKGDSDKVFYYICLIIKYVIFISVVSDFLVVRVSILIIMFIF